MDYTILNSSQRQQWDRFVSGMDELNRAFAKTRFDLWWLKQAIEFYKKQTETLPPDFQLDKISYWYNTSTKWMRGVTALNNAFALTQSGSAYLSPSQMISGDLDIIVEKDTLPESVVQNATFFPDDLPDGNMGIAPIVPLLIKGAIVIGGLVIVSGIVKQISDTIIKHKRIDSNIEKVKAKVELGMKNASPDIYKLWTDKKEKELKPAEQGFMSQLGEGLSGFIWVGIAALAFAIGWKMYSKKRNES